MSLVVRWAELEEQSFNRPEKDANKLKKKRYVNQNETLAHEPSVLP